MKLERLHEYILPAVVTTAGMAFAAYCGNLSGNGQTGTLVTVLVAMFVAAMFLIFRANIWMAIPLTFALGGQMPILPMPFAVRDLVIFAVFVCFLVLKGAKVVRLKPKLEAMDMWMFAMLLYLLSVYIRNPVGVDSLHAERVGGRNYFNVFVAGLAYWVLARALLAPRHTLLLIGLICIGRMSEGMLSFITYHFPQTVPVLSPFYSTVDTESYDAQDIRAVASTDEGTGRQQFLAVIGNPLVLALWSLFRPLTVINPIYIVRFSILLFGMGCIFASGFRTSFISNIAFMFIATYLRRGAMDIVRLILMILPVLLLLLVGQGVFFELPLTTQRTLSFLPAKWDPVALTEAQTSTKWRTDMWKIILSEEKYLHNKWLGDGFGFSQRDLVIMSANQATASPEALEENALISGGVHSGPISALRFVGGVGLFIYIGLMIAAARTAWRLIRRAKGTEYYALAFFLGLPLIWEPFYYLFIFGGFDSGLPLMIFGVGMLKMLGNSLDAYAASNESEKESEPVSHSISAWQRPPMPAGMHLLRR